MMKIDILEAAPGDTQVILDLIRALARYENLEHECTATAEEIRALFFGPRPFAEALLAWHQGQAVGLAVFFHNVSTFSGKPGLFLEDLFVRPGFRGRGVGEALLKELATLARRRGCRRMEWVALEWNRPAQEFYARLGAEVREGWEVWRLGDAGMTALSHLNPQPRPAASHATDSAAATTPA